MGGNDFEVEEGKEVVGRTIVGGRPRVRHKKKTRVPIGIEKLLCRAAMDVGLKRALLDDRDAVLASLGNEVSETESVILRSIPADTLALMIERIDVKKHARKRFMRGVVAASLLAASTMVADGCIPAATGAEPDWPDEDVMTQETLVEQDAAGVGTGENLDIGVPDNFGTSDLGPADTFEVETMPVDTGISPDLVEDADVVETDEMAVGGITPDAE